MLQLKKFPTYLSPLERKNEGPTKLKTSPVSPSFARDEGSFHCFFGKGFRAFQSHLKWRCSQLESREELQVSCHHSKRPQISQSTPEEPDYPALPRLSHRVSAHTTVARVTALWESLKGKPQIPVSTQWEAWHCCYSSGGKQTYMSQLEMRPDSLV